MKVANTQRELDDVFNLRYEVFVVEDGRFNKSSLEKEQIIDRFDELDTTVNIIAYELDNPVGTIRITKDSEHGLPPETYYNFSKQRKSLQDSCIAGLSPKPLVVSPSMLAVKKKWRGRRDVMPALFKLGIGMARSWCATHCFASVNHTYEFLYKRVGFNAIDHPTMNPSIGNSIVPMVATFNDVYEWAFGELFGIAFDRYWIDRFCGNFERVLLGAGEVLFEEGDVANNFYIIDFGWMQISRNDPEGKPITLGHLPRGALLGEAALVGSQNRSATATAPTSVELIVLSREDFRTALFEDKNDILDRFLRQISARIRRADDLAMITALSPQSTRVRFSLNELRKVANQDRRRPGTWVTRVSLKKLAKLAAVGEDDAKFVLEVEKLEGRLEYGQRSIRFLL